MSTSQVIIIGGGLAGLTAGIHLSKKGYSVVIIEENDYPRHKVCGEYISNEILPYFESLDLDVSELHPTQISELHFSSASGTLIKAKLPLGGFGISRYTLDHYLCNKALQNGCEIIQDRVSNVIFKDDEFSVVTENQISYTAKVVFAAYGKRSNLDRNLNRSFFLKKSHWLAVKAHYSGDFSNTVVGLHNFRGGYCGVSKVENDKINICYLTDYEAFKKYKNVADFEKMVLMQNPNLDKILQNATALFDKPITISQIAFDKKSTIENHILMIGDTAGVIHPLCGNGMAMAIHSAKLACESAILFLEEKATRTQMEAIYARQWRFHFASRLKMGRRLAKVLQKPHLSETLLRIFVRMPFLLPMIIRKTHGKPLTKTE